MNSLQLKRYFSDKIDPNLSNFAKIVSYPNLSTHESIKRIGEMQDLGITDIIFEGSTQIGKVSILGKGSVSIVLKARIKNKTYALKIRRMDANRRTMLREASVHQMVNTIGIGPKLFKFSENLIIMEFIDGLSIIDWIRQHRLDKYRVLNIVTNILKQCFILDMANINHGELSNLNYHIIVSYSDRVSIIDFESTSLNKNKSNNVTSASQSLFISGMISHYIDNILNLLSKDSIIEKLRTYKRDQNVTNFNSLIQTLSKSV
ncbi:MAG: RIO1 family regulatory kinase/ATPase [Nitrososphaeraceae archaeon]|jgi:putative serine/threonine protein kinase